MVNLKEESMNQSSISRNIEICAVVLTAIATSVLAFYAATELRQIRLQDSANLMLTFDKTLDEKLNQNVLDALDNKKGLKSVSDGEIYDLLGVYETIANLYNNNLITCDMINENFAYDLERIYQDSYVKEIVKNDQVESPELWIGFNKLGELFSKKDSCHK